MYVIVNSHVRAYVCMHSATSWGQPESILNSVVTI